MKRINELSQDEIAIISGGGENTMITTTFAAVGIVTAGIFFTNGFAIAAGSLGACTAINFAVGQNYSLGGLNKAYIKCTAAVVSGVFLFKMPKYKLRNKGADVNQVQNSPQTKTPLTMAKYFE